MSDLMHLFEIQQEYVELLDEIEEHEGILDDDTEERLGILEDEYETKMVAYQTKRKVLKGEIEVVKDYIESFSAKITAKENLSTRLAEKMLDALKVFGEDTKSGGKRFKNDLVNVFTVNRPKVDVDELSAEEVEGNFYNTYGKVAIELDLNFQQMQEVYAFIDDKFGKEVITKQDNILKKKKVLEDYKNGILVKTSYYFDENNVIVDVSDLSNDDKVNDTRYIKKSCLVNADTGDVYQHFDVVDNTFLSSR